MLTQEEMSELLASIVPEKEKTEMFSMDKGTPTFNGTLSSNILETMKNSEPKYSDIRTKWDQLQVGLKLGFHIKACANPVEKSRKQVEKEILEELKKKSNEPIIIKQDPQYIYIVPVCDQMDDDESGFTPEDKADVEELTKALANTNSRTFFVSFLIVSFTICERSSFLNSSSLKITSLFFFVISTI